MKIMALLDLRYQWLPFRAAMSEIHRLLLVWSQNISQCNGLLPQVECVLRVFSALQRCFSALSQDAVQAIQLAEETSVRDDTSVVFYCLDGLHKRQILSDHQVG